MPDERALGAYWEIEDVALRGAVRNSATDFFTGGNEENEGHKDLERHASVR
jgi:hypothetical protein